MKAFVISNHIFMATKKVPKTTIQKKTETTKKKVNQQVVKAQKTAEREMKKIKKELAAAEKKTVAYIKKNPEKATAISAGIGAALGATIAALAVDTTRKKKKSIKKKK